MVGTIILGVCILGAVALICFKGINVKYDKSFTVDDKRIQAQMDHEELQRLEKKLNEQNTTGNNIKSSNEDETVVGPMDAVIAEMHELFGPEPDQKDDRR